MNTFRKLFGISWVIALFIAVMPIFAQDGTSTEFSWGVALPLGATIAIALFFAWAFREAQRSLPQDASDKIYNSVPKEVVDSIVDKVTKAMTDLAIGMHTDFDNRAKLTDNPYDNIASDVIGSIIEDVTTSSSVPVDIDNSTNTGDTKEMPAIENKE